MPASPNTFETEAPPQGNWIRKERDGGSSSIMRVEERLTGKENSLQINTDNREWAEIRAETSSKKDKPDSP